MSSTVFKCVECQQHYCVTCDDGGEDSCRVCHTGPRCNHCAIVHERSDDEHYKAALRYEREQWKKRRAARR